MSGKRKRALIVVSSEFMTIMEKYNTRFFSTVKGRKKIKKMNE